ncbi:MAG: J domain-containing protein [Pseudomonadota bacterium]|nr:J domain-containing protein [Pseudomonadota bacterium]
MGDTDIPEELGAAFSCRKPLEPGIRLCCWPDCAQLGEHRAPVSRDNLSQFYWFCLDHVRIYNRSWNYYVGMSEAEVEACVRSDTTWNRPSWPFAGGKVAPREFDFGNVDDPQGAMGWDGTGSGSPTELSVQERQAFSVLGLEFPVTRDEVKMRYKELVKRHHPDANGGKKDAEERIKRINQAHEVLMSSMFL